MTSGSRKFSIGLRILRAPIQEPTMNRLPAAAIATALFLSLDMSAFAQSERAPLAAEVQQVRNLLGANRTDEAIAQAEKATTARPDDGKAWLWLGNAYGQKALEVMILAKPKWAGKCRDAYEKAVAVSPADPDPRLQLIQYYLQAPGFMGGGRDKAEAQVEALQAIGAVWGHIGQAALLLADDKREEAIGAYADAFAADPGNRRATLGLISMYLREQRFADARTVAEAALARDPRDAIGLYMLGRIAVDDGQRIEEGIESLATYIRLDSHPEELGVAAAWWRKGLLFEKAGRQEEAVQALRTAIGLDAQLEQARKDLQRLES